MTGHRGAFGILQTGAYWEKLYWWLKCALRSRLIRMRFTFVLNVLKTVDDDASDEKRRMKLT